MSVTPANLINVERFVFKPAFVLVTFVLLIFAVFQASGRFSLSVVHLFEDEINTVLQEQRIKVSGLKGGWQVFNPTLSVARIEFSAGSVEGVTLEIDVLESIYRGAVVARDAQVGNAELIAEQTASGWRLLGQTAGESVDLETTLLHSDRLQASGRIALLGRSGRTSVVNVEVASSNLDRTHHARIAVNNDADKAKELRVQWWRQDSLEHGIGGPPQESALLIEGELLIPSVFTAMEELLVKVERAHWSERGGRGNGYAQVVVNEAQGASMPIALNTSVALGLKSIDGTYHATTERFEVWASGAAEDALVIGPVFAKAVVSEANPTPLIEQLLPQAENPVREPTLRFWLGELDLAALTRFANAHLADWEPVGRWLGALAAEGFARNLHGYVDAERGAGFMTSVVDVHMQGYKGAPTLERGQGQIWGHPRGVAMQLNAQDVGLKFPDLYHEGWEMDSLQGLVKAWFAPGYFGLRGPSVRGRLQESTIAGAFAVSRPDPRYEQRVSLQLEVDQAGMTRALTFVPYKIPDELATWLEQGPQAGHLSNARFAYHGQVHTRPDELGRRIELLADVSDGAMFYDSQWPLVTDFTGRVHAAGVQTTVELDGALSHNVRLKQSRVVLQDNAAYADVHIDAEGDGQDLLRFVLESPLKERLSFVQDEWEASGRARLNGALVVPLKDEDVPGIPELAVDLDFELLGLDLHLPEFRTQLHELVGRGTFQLPHMVTGQFEGRLFDAPTSIAASAEERWVKFAIQGTARPDDVYRMIEFDGEFPAEGQIGFDSVLSIAMEDSLISNLSVVTDLQGLAVNLPGELNKVADARTPSEFDIQFLPRYQVLRWQYLRTNGWLHYSEQIERGAIGIGASPPMTEQNQKAISISGSMADVRLSDWVTDDDEAAFGLPIDWQIRDLNIGVLHVDELQFADMRLQGSQTGDDLRFEFEGEELVGTVRIDGDALMQLDLDYLRLPVEDETLVFDEGFEGDPTLNDPLTVATGRALPAADVTVKRLDLGDEPFGEWRFVIHPEPERVTFKPFATHVNGVHTEAGELVWDLERNRASFVGRITLDDLEHTLPKWDYAPTLMTQEAALDVNAEWAGSPANVSLLGLQGDIGFEASDGRFLEVDSANGGLRIMSLLNFSNIAKRINFDFSDVTGEGITFNKIEANVEMDEGQLDIVERMVIDSTSSNFEVGGSVDLRNGTLDNEMIVTLPVSNSLPWYGVYLALANPLAGIGVLVGERVLRKPIQQFSTAKFTVRGTLEEPEVDFVRLFDRSMRAERQPTDVSAAQESGG